MTIPAHLTVAGRLLHVARRNAQRTGSACAIVESDIVVPTYCPLVPLRAILTARNGTSASAPTVDTTDPAGNYTPATVRVLSKAGQRMRVGKTTADCEAILAQPLPPRLKDVAVLTFRVVERQKARRLLAYLQGAAFPEKPVDLLKLMSMPLDELRALAQS
jgi:hypothetical protein